MGPLANLVQAASVAKGPLLLAEYVDGEEEVFQDCMEYLERVTNNHSRYTYTVNGRTFSCLMEDGFIFYAVVDEALSKDDVFRFLKDARNALRKLLKRRGLPCNGEGLGAHSLDAEFGPVLKRLASPFVGIPQEELERTAALRSVQNGAGEGAAGAATSPPVDDRGVADAAKGGEKQGPPPARGKGGKCDERKVKEQVNEVKEIMMGNIGQALSKGEKMEILVGGTSGTSDCPMNGHHGNVRVKRQQLLAQRTWWRNVKLVLLLDVSVCLILFCVWLGICGGIKCLSHT